MDHSLVARIVEDWKLAAPPLRPSMDAINRYRRMLPKCKGGNAFVQGATPEVLDMLVADGIGRIVSMDLHAETMEAMRHFAHEDWGRVEMIVGDWCTHRPDFDGAFDLVISDGGPLFVQFPDDWRQLYEVTFRYLVPGGTTMFRHFTVPRQQPDFWSYYGQALDRFDAESRDMDPDQQVSMFVAMLSDVRSVGLYGAVDSEGRVSLERCGATFQAMVNDLMRRYSQGNLRRVLDALFGRSNPVGKNGVILIAMPHYEQIQPVLESLGFVNVGMQAVNEPPAPGLMMIISATRPDGVSDPRNAAR